MNVRPASLDDLILLMEIARSSGPAAQWSQEQWRDIFRSQNPERRAWICETREASGEPLRAAGFLVAQVTGPDWELENVAVLPEFRRRGAAIALISALLSQARANAASRILLEVRASNQGAIRLYEHTGFCKLACRPGYYSNPPEDALIYVHPF
jgi:ribosomal-protein-alanine N-acetyltransferase